jgi:hypothetical protein
MAFVKVQLKNRVEPALLDEKEYRANPDKWTLYVEPKEEASAAEPPLRKVKKCKKAEEIVPSEPPVEPATEGEDSHAASRSQQDRTYPDGSRNQEIPFSESSALDESQADPSGLSDRRSPLSTAREDNPGRQEEGEACQPSLMQPLAETAPIPTVASRKRRGTTIPD